MQDDESIPEQTSHVAAVNSSKWPSTAIAIVIIALATGISGYLLGSRNNQSNPPSQPSPTITTQTSVFTPSPKPAQAMVTMSAQPLLSNPSPNLIQAMLTSSWKIYRNERLGFSFKYPEEWFPQEVPGWIPPGDSIYFYPYGVTPHPGGADDPTNAVFAVTNQNRSEQDIKQIISTARQTYGQRVLNVAGKPAIKGDWYYIIKLSSTRLLILVTYNEDGVKRLDTIISTIKFTNE